MDKVLQDYHISSLPTKRSKRTGKAKNCLFEEIDLNLYNDDKIVTFYTSLERTHYWIKTLDIFYYDHLGSSESLEINWYDEPSKWTDHNNSSNAIVIEVLNTDTTLQYNVTFFVTTGTIRVQGSKTMTFVRPHFPILKEILAKVLENCTVDEHQNDLDQTIIHTAAVRLDDEISEEVEENSDSSIISVKSVINNEKSTIISSVNQTGENLSNFARLEASITTAFMQMETYQADSTNKIIMSVSDCCKKISELIDKKGKNAQTEIPTLQKSINSLREKNQLLETKLKIQESNAALERCQNADSVRNMKLLLDETRSQLKQSVETANSESNIHAERMKAKIEEIQQLTVSVANLTAKLDHAQDEILQLKMHISALMDSNIQKLSVKPTDTLRHPDVTLLKPKVLLLGTSNIKNINETKLSDAVNVEKVVKYTLEETETYVKSHDEAPDLVVIHSLTNDLKAFSPQKCVDELDSLICIIHKKWPNVKIVISLTTPRKDDIGYYTNGQIINALVKQKILGDQSTFVSYCEHNNMLFNGNPINDLLSDDKYHLSTKGVSFLASNLKRAIHNALKIPMATQRRNRSRSRGPW